MKRCSWKQASGNRRTHPGRLILAVLLALAVTLAPVTPLASTASALTCQVRLHRGKRICWCWDGRWVTAPMILCRLAEW